jgi:hypothetical protein
VSTTTEPEPFLRVTVGSPVFSSDERKLGSVKERRNNAFKVGTPLLQRDYWLPAGTIRSAIPDGAVVLWVAWTELEEFKLAQPPAAA